VNRYVKRTLIGFAAFVLCAAMWVAYEFGRHPALAPYANLALAPDPAGAGEATGLRVTFLGVSTLLFDDGDTAFLTDGFFTRPDWKTVLTRKVMPDPERIAQSLERAGSTRLAAVLVTHSHYDHAMDSPEVARRTGALLVGSESTANIARGWNLAENKIRIVRNGDQIQLGRFQIMFIQTRHAPTGFTGGEIPEPLVPPVRANRYREGTSFSVLIRHGGKALLVQSTAGFVEGALRGQKADVVFLGMGALGKQGEAYLQAYWHETVQSVGAARVIPIHWDDFTRPLDQPLVPLPYLFDDLDRSMAFILDRGRREGIEVTFAPAWVKFDPFAGSGVRSRLP
jgi:L-ascorbate metabolism protein UlaG (beta-lactamase superfamily)